MARPILWQVQLNASKAQFNDLAELKKQVEADNKGYTLTTTTNTKVTLAGTGKELILQIGDTSETFNRLNVSVNDCHSDATEN